MMDINDTEKHERVLLARLGRHQLESLIEKAVAEATGVSIDLIRKHGKVKIEPNMEGSPEYQSGFKASVSATIPLSGSREA